MVRLEFGLGLDCGLAMCTYERLFFVGSFFFWMRMRGEGTAGWPVWYYFFLQ